MRTERGLIIWTSMLLHMYLVKGQTSDSAQDLITSLNEVISNDRVTSKSVILESRLTSTYQDVSSPPTEFSNPNVTPTVPPSQPSEDSTVHSDTSYSPAISQTPASQDVTTLNMEKTSVPASSVSSTTVSDVRSTVSESVVTTRPATSISPGEGHQTFSPLTSSVSQTTQAALPVTLSYPAPSQFALTSSSNVTGPSSLEHQDVPSELDVGDEESNKVQHGPTSPVDPLFATLFSIFIICTAMVSAVLFLRSRQRSEHPEFHRLQDLPMDDLLEDTPLSRYTY
ncbi:DNA-directed RNA polymerase II subunit RPB1-like [Xyrauchen texanus]|uniref:DNA-directed RNA polymerase II subunit RPB1-like n=1 Tax=Xyrauchen texanus TaxID=154827 RepID=UPI00224247FD|nr:DNA-directed RNA polymerase II subunit RPB1-like [Xyrauchen texanus]